MNDSKKEEEEEDKLMMIRERPKTQNQEIYNLR